MRRCSGIWPPSKPGLRAEPLRLFWPFSPRPAVLPSPLPGPRPTRLRLRTAPRAGFSLSRPTLSPPLLDDPDQVRDLVDHPPHRLRVLPLHDLVHAPQPEPAHRLALVAGAADHAPDHLDLDRARRLALALGHAVPLRARRSARLRRWGGGGRLGLRLLLDAQHVLHRLVAQPRHTLRALQPLQRVDGGFDDVVRRGAAQALGEDVLD